jgi:hypothetical protein
MEQLKTIKWATNYNEKLKCNAFIHIDFPPTQTLVPRQWENKEFEIEVADASYRNTRVRLIDIITLDICKHPIPEAFTLPSHGMTQKEFVDYLFEKFPKRMGNTPQLSVYYYKKLE